MSCVPKAGRNGGSTVRTTPELRRGFTRRLLTLGSTVGVIALIAGCTNTNPNAAPEDSGASGGGTVLSTVEELKLTEEQIADVQSRDLTFGFLVNNIADDFSSSLVASAEEAAEQYGVELIVNSADFDANRQLTQFNALVQQGVDGIFLTAVDAAAIGTAVVAANQADIPVMIVGGPPGRGEVVTVMNAASYDGSKEAAAVMMEAIGEPNAQVAVIGIPFALQTIRDREKGVLDAVGEAGGQIVSLQSDFNQDRLLALATNAIEANPDLRGIFATWSLGVNAAVEAVRQSGRTDIVIAGYDSEAAGYIEFANGNESLVALSGQQAYVQGFAAIEGLLQVVLGNSLAPELITPNLLVTPDNYVEQWDIQYPGTPAPF